MLQHLSIENYSLIEKIEVNFGSGLSVITGETGAGKSIIIGALSLILGQRADTEVLLNKSKKCIIEGTFDIKGFGWKDFFENNLLDYDDSTILRREINQHGKSRAFINDTPINLNLLSELGDKLVDVHSQHKTLTLSNSNFQLEVVDNYIQHYELLDKYKTEYRLCKKISDELNELIKTEKKAKADKDYFQFQFDELESLRLVQGEQEEIENELKMLNHTEEIKDTLNKILDVMSSSDSNIISMISDIQSQLVSFTEFRNDIKDISKRLNVAHIEIKDIASEINCIEQQIVPDPSRLETISDRIDVIYRVQQKHRVNSIEELITLKNEFLEKLFSISSLDEKIKNLNEEITLQMKKTKLLAMEISANRQQAIPVIEKGLKKILTELGMPDGQVQINITELDNFSQNGIDKIQFMFNANKGGEMKELSKIASGGEMSRFMLGVKSLISQKNLLPTIIFDEIDAGVSGEIAIKVGAIMKKISNTMQVIAITHLPQIASIGDNHYFVYKDSLGKTTRSHIKQLTEKERITEIAKMMSGDKFSKSSINTAKKLRINH